MNLSASLLIGLLVGGLFSVHTRADERRFSYTYEPETTPAGAMELENWVTLRAGRGESVGQKNFNRWDLRQEIEYGVTDRYTLGLYLNESAQSYREPGGANHSEFDWQGVSIENRYNLLNPAEHAIGLTLYLEGTYSGEEAALEEKIIIGQRYGDWKWALNLSHETGWEDNLRKREGELGASFGLARDLGKNWSLGLEARNITLLPEYEEFESSAVYVGPVLSYRQERWWAALAVMPQVYGWNNGGGDGNPHLELTDNERLNVRFLVGLNF